MIFLYNLQELPTQAMIAKEVKEKKKAKLVADIENLMKELQASLEQHCRFIERKKAIKKTKVVIENLVDELQVRTKKNMMQIESKRDQIREIVARLVAQIRASMGELKNLFMLENYDVAALLSKKRQVKFLLDNLPKRQRKQMEARYSCQLEETEALIAYQDSHNSFLDKIIDALSTDRSSTNQDVSSSKHPLASQPLSSSTIVSF